MADTLMIAVLGLLLLVNALGVALVALQLPGTWVIVLATLLTAWFYPEHIGWWTTCVALVLLAVLGEVIEFLAGAAGATRAGGSRRGALLAILGSIIGAIAGTPLIPIPVLGTLLGACAGALAGALAGDLWAGRTWEASWQAGRGAAWGKFWGTLAKLGVAVVMWIVVAVAVFWP